MRQSPPTPEVQYLPAIFRKIQNGDIRIPAFQRDFVWTENQVLALLESVYRGFPMGSILLWRVNSKILKVEAPIGSIFPNLPEEFPLSYVLDGLQRLSALYGCFHWSSVNKSSPYNVFFDLVAEEFVHFRGDQLPKHYISLSKIFTPKEFLESQRILSKEANSDRLLDVAVNLHSSFQEYMIPTVTISDRDVEEVVEIFERINSTGTRLDTVDFLRAVTWSEAFDLNDALEIIRESAGSEGFNVPDETALKIFAMALDKNPTPEEMLQLRKFPAHELKNARNQAAGNLALVFSFLKKQCSIYSYDFVPYEGQLLLLAKYARCSGASFWSNIEEMRRWFLVTSFNEGYRGKPDSYLVRDMKHIEEFVKGQSSPLSTKLSITEQDFFERLFTRGKALSAAVANLFTSTNPRSFFTGNEIPVEAYMREFETSNYGFVVPLPEFKNIYGNSTRTNRTLANVFLLDENELRKFNKTDPIDFFNQLPSKFKDYQQILESQLISEEAFENFRGGKYHDFLLNRAATMFEKAKNIVD